MTPTIDAPADTGDQSLFDDISAALNEGSEPTEEQPAEEGVGTAGDTPGGEEPTAPPVVPGDAPQPPGEGPSYQLTEDGKSYIVPKEEVTAFTGLKQYADEVQQMFPTANDAKAAHGESSTFRAVLSDYLYGKESDADQVLMFLAGANATEPQYKQNSEQAFTRMAQRMPDVLKKISPEAHEQLTTSILQARVEAAYERAAAEPNNEMLLTAAQRLEWATTSLLSGGAKAVYRTDDAALRSKFGVEAPKRFDPNQAANEKIAKDRADIDQRTNEALGRDFQNFNKEQMDGAKWTAYNAEINAALKAHEKNYPPKIFASIRKAIDSDVRAKLQQDLDWARVHNNERRALEDAYGQLWKQRQPADSLKQRIEGYKNDFLSRARRYLPSIAKEYLDQATANAVAQNAQTRAQNGRFTKPATPPANGQQKPNESASGRRYDIHSDPEWTSQFRN